MHKTIAVRTRAEIQMVEITREVQELVDAAGTSQGQCVVYCPHTTAGLVINENADPDVCFDLERAFAAAVPELSFKHAEGNSHSHFLSCLTGSSVTILIENGRLLLGRWQGIFLCEFDGPRSRSVWVRLS